MDRAALFKPAPGIAVDGANGATSVEVTADPATRSGAEPRAAEEGGAATRAPADVEILIVQDDPMFADMLEYALRAQGRAARAVHDLAEARNAIERLAEKAAPGPRPVVVLDPTARGLGSLDLMTRFGRFGSGRLQFVALGSDSSESAEILAFECGASDVVAKPAHLPALLTRIDCLLRAGAPAAPAAAGEST